MSITTHTSSTHSLEDFRAVAHGIELSQRRNMAIDAIKGVSPISHIAARHDVSRNFIYKQKDLAIQGITEAFRKKSLADQDKALFNIPVTKTWIKQLILGLSLCCHSSFRGIQEILDGVFDHQISIGNIHNIVQDAIGKAKAINDKEDLSSIKVGALDEIFQGDTPVLVGCEPKSLYCFLLSPEESRDSNTWGCHLLELQKKGLQPEYTVADFGNGLRAGQREAWPEIPCHGDVFHAEMDLGKLFYYLENRAKTAMSTLVSLDKKMNIAKKKGQGHKFTRKIGDAWKAADRAIQLVDDIKILNEWLQELLLPTGPCLEEKKGLYDFIVQELKKREPLCEYRIPPVRKKLENHRESLLQFVELIDSSLAGVAEEMDVSIYDVRQMYILQSLPYDNPKRWEYEQRLRKRLRGKFYSLCESMQNIASNVVRASSSVENLNSRLRNYFFLRKQIGSESLDLLRFYLNHRRFPRSERPERVGRSPAELLTGKEIPHWLELLGFERFRRQAA